VLCKTNNELTYVAGMTMKLRALCGECMGYISKIHVSL